jgi:hypothetical protein
MIRPRLAHGQSIRRSAQHYGRGEDFRRVAATPHSPTIHNALRSGATGSLSFYAAGRWGIDSRFRRRIPSAPDHWFGRRRFQVGSNCAMPAIGGSAFDISDCNCERSVEGGWE